MNEKRLGTVSRGLRSSDIYLNDRGFYSVAFRECAYSMPVVVTFWDRQHADKAVDAFLGGKAAHPFAFETGGPASLDRALSR